MIDTGNIAELITAISGCLTGVAGTIIAILLYRLNKRQQRDSWITTYKEIHETFWNDEVMARVRHWINYEKPYQQLKPILQKRKEIDNNTCSSEELTETECQCLDNLDKFYNLAQRVAVITAELEVGGEQIIWKRLYTDYWVNSCLKVGREDLKWYVDRFYPELLQPELLESTIKQLKK